MPVPWETLVPYIAIGGLFVGAGYAGEHLQKRFTNGGYYRRTYADAFDQALLKRDYRLTGVYRKQSTNAVAPAEFATNSSWHAVTRRTPFGTGEGVYTARTR